MSAYAVSPDVFNKLSALMLDHSVLMPPGSMIITSIPNLLTSNLKLSLNPSKANLVA